MLAPTSPAFRDLSLNDLSRACSASGNAAIGAWITARVERPIVHDPDQMGVSDVFAHVLEQIDAVAARGKRFACGRGNRALGDERAIGGPKLHASDEPTGRPDRARGV